MRDLTPQQETLIDRPETRPVFLIEAELDPGNVEHLSTGGDLTVDEQPYTGADVGIVAIDNWSRAVLKFRPSAARVASILTGDYRRAQATVSLLPIFNYPLLIDPDYVESSYANNGTETGAPILLLDGVMISADAADSVEVTVAHRATVGYWSPRLRITSEWCNHLPQPGRVLEWQGEKYILEAD